MFLWSRISIWLGALFVLFAIVNGDPSAIHRDDPTVIHDLGAFTDVWARWDSFWFIQIGHHGYGVANGAPAFYPLYPSLVGVAGRVFLGHYVLGGLVVSLAATLGSFILLGRLAEGLCGPEVAIRSVLLLAVWPMTLFLLAVYSESVFLLLAIAAFLAAEHRRFLYAGALAGLSLLDRPTGIAVLVGILILAARSRRLAELARVAIAIPIFAVFPIVLWLEGRSPTAFLHAESLWYRHTATLGPIGGLWDAMRVAWASIRQLLWHPAHPFWSSGANHFAVINLESTAFLLIYVFLGVVAWRTLGAAYGVMALVAVLGPVAAPTRDVPLLSMPRFGLVAFPVFIALATLCRSPRVERAVVGSSAVLLGVAVVQWALWQWVS